jgi:hypothetical protein
MYKSISYILYALLEHKKIAINRKGYDGSGSWEKI